jgi:hypothetical protein
MPLRLMAIVRSSSPRRNRRWAPLSDDPRAVERMVQAAERVDRACQELLDLARLGDVGLHEQAVTTALGDQRDRLLTSSVIDVRDNVIVIATGEICGVLPHRALREVREWASIHRDELAANRERTQVRARQRDELAAAQPRERRREEDRRVLLARAARTSARTSSGE